jgi:glycine/D-amino acid oxidase-like deaminating enzyme
MMLHRREFLSAALVGLTQKAGKPVAGGFVNESQHTGHRLRDRTLATAPKQSVRVPVIIIGAGIAGLSAAWRLNKRGFGDFVLLEMESQPGGNSRWGQSEVTAYPWAAHYIPAPDRSLSLVRELMEELGVLHDGVWDERHLCFSPQERVFVHGHWQEGFEPDTRDEREEWRRFEERMTDFRGGGAFPIPVSETPKSPELDRMSMSDWLNANSFKSSYLRWYVDYACRDDYGASSGATSAWMGIHYFASRGHDEKGPLTWPEGNGWVVQRLVAKLARYLRTDSPVVRIVRKRRGFTVLTPHTAYESQVVIFAAPTFLAPYLLEGVRPFSITYSPWVTANLHLDRMPREKGFELAWDNVIRDSPSLGYVVANHMSLASRRERSVWTWYMPLANTDASTARRELLRSDWSYWRDFILNDLSRAHPDIRECVSRIDVMRFGHAMARPVPGVMFDPERGKLAQGDRGFFYANSDVSGYSIFEEAQYRGVRAADAALRLL